MIWNTRNIQAHVNIHLHMQMCTHRRTCTHTQTQTHTYTYTHTHTQYSLLSVHSVSLEGCPTTRTFNNGTTLRSGGSYCRYNTEINSNSYYSYPLLCLHILLWPSPFSAPVLFSAVPILHVCNCPVMLFASLTGVAIVTR